MLRTHFQISNRVNNGFIMFSFSNITIKLICPDSSSKTVINGSALVIIPLGCRVKSDLFNFDRENVREGLFLENRIPKIVCCSKIFESNDKGMKTAQPIIFRSLHEIHSIDGSNIETELKLWDKFKNFDFKHHADNWGLHYASIIGAAILLSFIIWLRFGKPCLRQADNNFRVSIRTSDKSPEDNRSVYPLF